MPEKRLKKLILGLRNRARLGGLRSWSALCLTAVVLILVAQRADQLSYDSYVLQVKSDTRVALLDCIRPVAPL